MHRRTLLKAISATSACFGLAHAQSPAWPSRPVRVIVPYAAGGGPDLLARKMAPELARALGTNVVVENKVGAAGIVAAEVSAQAPPDGYLVLLGSNSHIVNKIMQPAVKFDPLTSFAPVTLMASGAGVLVVPADSPWRTDVKSFFRPATSPTLVTPRKIVDPFAVHANKIILEDQLYKRGQPGGGTAGTGTGTGGNPCG